MDIHIDLDKAIELVRESISARPEGWGYVYVTPDSTTEICRYVYGHQPSCLIGQALFRAGVDLHDLKKLDMYGPIWTAANYLPSNVAIDEEALKFFSTVQGQQDDEVPWGEAFYVGLHSVGRT